MTHTYKVGDKGKTRGGDQTADDKRPQDYEVIAVGRDLVGGKSIVAIVGGFAHEFYGDGRTHGPQTDYWLDLIPPKRRIQGWVNVYPAMVGRNESACAGVPIFSDRRHADESATAQRLACIYIDIEEGEGL